MTYVVKSAEVSSVSKGQGLWFSLAPNIIAGVHKWGSSKGLVTGRGKHASAFECAAVAAASALTAAFSNFLVESMSALAFRPCSTGALCLQGCGWWHVKRKGWKGLSLHMHACRHRNAVVDAAGEPPLGASLTGPGPADAVVRECAVTAEKNADAVAAVEVVCAARTAGDYVLSVFHLDTGERLFGSPFAVRAGPSSDTIIPRGKHL